MLCVGGLQILANLALAAFADGRLTISGLGGANGDNNNGVLINGLGQGVLISTNNNNAAGGISITGTGGGGSSAKFNSGVTVIAQNAVVETTNLGNIVITGEGRGGSGGLASSRATATL